MAITVKKAYQVAVRAMEKARKEFSVDSHLRAYGLRSPGSARAARMIREYDQAIELLEEFIKDLDEPVEREAEIECAD